MIGVPDQETIRFGLFVADLHSTELKKGQDRIPLQNLPFRILTLLLREPGRVVTREELRQQLWPENTFVDFERGISTAVSKLREALGDSAANPRFIETVGRRGYRFIAPVSVVAPPAVPEPRAVSTNPGAGTAQAAAVQPVDRPRESAPSGDLSLGSRRRAAGNHVDRGIAFTQPFRGFATGLSLRWTDRSSYYVARPNRRLAGNLRYYRHALQARGEDYPGDCEGIGCGRARGRIGCPFR